MAQIERGAISRDHLITGTYLLVLVLVVLLVVSPFLFFLCFVLVFTVPLDMVSWVEAVFWANTAMLLRRERPSEAIMILFIKIVSVT
ncbi:MAG: hypothetical protein JO210_12595 [Acidobacteriaceae bacterium]|nr:hypothetical protein [Acidobacteriaceae bacterium]